MPPLPKKKAAAGGAKGGKKKVAPPKKKQVEKKAEEEETILAKAKRVWASDDKETKKVVIHYGSTYKTAFECREGIVRWTDIDEEYAISFVFAGNFEKRVVANDNVVEAVVDGDETYFVGLDDDNGRYVLHVEEDPEAGLNVKTTAGPIQFATTQTDNVLGTRRKEGCSCLYGNPCADPECCQDWHNRFDVAARNGWKGF